MYVNQVEKKKKVKETSAKYEGIVRWIREQIEAEELQPGERDIFRKDFSFMKFQ